MESQTMSSFVLSLERISEDLYLSHFQELTWERTQCLFLIISIRPGLMLFDFVSFILPTVQKKYKIWRLPQLKLFSFLNVRIKGFFLIVECSELI